MKYIFYIFLYLNIYTIFSSEAIAQQLYLEIKAETDVSEALLDSLSVTRNFENYIALKSETDSLQVRLLRYGYIESRLDTLVKYNDSVYTANFFFGRKFNVVKVYYNSDEFSKKELQRVTSDITDTYFTIPFTEIEIALQKLNEIKTEKGDAFASTRLKNISVENNTLAATIDLQSGTQKTVDAIVVKGYDKFPKSFLRYYAGVKIGKPFSKQKIISQNAVINNLGFATSIKPPETLFEKDSTTVYFYFKKQPNNLFDGVIGFATDEETNKLVFNGYLDLVLNNNLNFGEQFSLNYKSDGNDQQNFKVNAKLPYLFKSPVGLELELNIFKRDTTFVTTEQKALATYQLNTSSTAFGGYKSYESSNLADANLGGTAVTDYKANFVVTGLDYKKSQPSTLFPFKTNVIITSEIGKRASEGMSENQQKFSATASHIINLNYKNSVYLKSSSSILLSESFLTNELFRFGGITSIRGFDENSIDASLLSVLNTEYRYQVNEGAYIHSVIDFGYFKNEVAIITEKLYSFGAGIGLATKAGVFRLIVANGNTEKQTFSFNNTKIHLSLSSRF